MFRSIIDERKVIDAVKRAIEIDRPEDPILLPSDASYPEQVWIQLPPFCGLNLNHIINLQRALLNRELYSISIHATAVEDEPHILICAYGPEMRPEFFTKDF